MFQKLLLKDRTEFSLPNPRSDERLTRFGPQEERPECASHLTRFSKRHVRDDSSESAQNTASVPARQTPASVPQAADTDLYSDAPISVNVLMRALPQRFAQVQANISDAFDLKDNPTKHA